jgi:hypothetical protein
MIRTSITMLSLVPLIACPPPHHSDIEDRLVALEGAQIVSQEERATLVENADLLGLTVEQMDIRVVANTTSAAEAQIDRRRIDRYAEDSRALIAVLDDELSGTADAIEGSRLDTLQLAVDEQTLTVSTLDDEIRGTFDTISNSRLDTLEMADTASGLNARLSALESAGFATQSELAALPFASLQQFDVLASDVLALENVLPVLDTCGSGDVMAYDDANGWFDCAPSTSVGRVVNVTTYTNGATRDLASSPQAVYELERLTVIKQSSTSSLIIQGSLSVRGAGGPSTATWQYGTGQEVDAQLASGQSGTGTSLSTTSMLSGLTDIGANELVLRVRSEGSPPPVPFQMYNPDDRDFGNTLSNSSTYVIWEVESS